VEQFFADIITVSPASIIEKQGVNFIT